MMLPQQVSWYFLLFWTSSFALPFSKSKKFWKWDSKELSLPFDYFLACLTWDQKVSFKNSKTPYKIPRHFGINPFHYLWSGCSFSKLFHSFFWKKRKIVFLENFNSIKLAKGSRISNSLILNRLNNGISVKLKALESLSTKTEFLFEWQKSEFPEKDKLVSFFFSMSLHNAKKPPKRLFPSLLPIPMRSNF